MSDGKMTGEKLAAIRECVKTWDMVFPDDANAMLAHVAAQAAELAALRGLLQWTWEDIVDGDWITYARRDYEHEHPLCGQCQAAVAWHYFSPNEHGGKTFLGHSCEHTAECIVPQIEAALGIDNAQLVAVARAQAEIDAVTKPSIHELVKREQPASDGALPPIVDWIEHG